MFRLDNSKVPNGTVLTMGIRYEGMGQTDLDTTRGRQTPRVFTYVFLKAGGLWYGTGKAPQGAGWGAVNKWLDRDNRVVEWVKVARPDAWTTVYGTAPDPEVDTSQASE